MNIIFTLFLFFNFSILLRNFFFWGLILQLSFKTLSALCRLTSRKLSIDIIIDIFYIDFELLLLIFESAQHLIKAVPTDFFLFLFDIGLDVVHVSFCCFKNLLLFDGIVDCRLVHRLRVVSVSRLIQGSGGVCSRWYLYFFSLFSWLLLNSQIAKA